MPKTRKLRRLGTGRQARRAGGGSAKRTFCFQRPQLADAKYARLKRPVLEDAPPPVAARQLLLCRGLLWDQVRVARERLYLRLLRRCSGAARRRRALPRRRASRARGAARQQIGRKRSRLLFATCVACRSGCAECTSRTPGGKPIVRCRRLLLLYASHTCANRVLMLRAARARCTG